MIRRLCVRFVLINMTIVTVMLFVILGLVYHFTGQSLEEESIRTMQSLSLVPGFAGVRPGTGSEEIRIPYFTVRKERSGEISAVGGTYYDLSDSDLLNRLVDEANESMQAVGVLEEYRLRYLKIAAESAPESETEADAPNFPALPAGEAAAATGAQMIVFADISGEMSTLRHLLRSLVLIGLAGFLAFLVLSILLARWSVRPVGRAMEQQRHFIADASHELKTPLAVILTNAGMLAQSRQADNIRTTALQMRSLIEHMLSLARAEEDAGRAEADAAPVSFSEIADDAVLNNEALFYEHGLTLMGDVEPGLLVRGSEAALRQIPDILLDNALKYADPGTEVHLTLQRSERRGPFGRHGQPERLGWRGWTGRRRRHVVLTVSNRGADLSAEDCRHIFDRFYRVDESRHRDGSYGLGLAVARQAVTHLHGKIEVSSVDALITFTVTLPAAPM